MTRHAPAFLALALFVSPLYAAELHVATGGNDAHAGTAAAPLRTLQRAADLAQPGDTVTVHEGVYRERVNPPRGGESDARRITYQAAKGEKVVVKGSEPVKDWVKVQNDTWKTTLPNSFFGKFNPYSDLIRGDWFSPNGRQHHTGAVYLNGEWLIEAPRLDDVLLPVGAAPVATGNAGHHVLLNVAWLRPGTGGGSKGRIPAIRYAAKEGPRAAPCTEGGECLGWIEHGHWLRYEKVDFGTGTEQVELRVASATEGGDIELRLDGPTGPVLGTATVASTGDWQAWTSVRAKIKPTSGLKTLCLVFRGRDAQSLAANLWFAKVDDKQTTIWAQFPNVDPNTQDVEINVRRTVFYPDKTGRNYITVRGFTLRDAATPWAPPTAEQIGLIGTNWSKGWIIEDNHISHSVCSGVALGKHGDKFDNTSANSAEGYVETIHRALKNGWNRETIGHHVVRRNTISHCEQTGVVGSMGAAFSTICDNTIHDIHVRRLFGGAEMAGIKLHAAIDVQVVHNHIYRTCLGLWFDWMAQGTRISCNLLHHNGRDLFVEVDHGPFLVENNVFLSPATLLDVSQGGAYVHNLILGSLAIHTYDARQTPYHKPHSTELAGMHDNPNGDDRWYNNVFVGPANLTPYDKAKMPVFMEGNVYLKGAKPSRHEAHPLVLPNIDPRITLVERNGSFYLEGDFDKTWTDGAGHRLITTQVLGKALVPDAAYEQPDGTPLRLDIDHRSRPRSATGPTPGPFEAPGQGAASIRVR